jgi:TIGR03009 family protein
MQSHYLAALLLMLGASPLLAQQPPAQPPAAPAPGRLDQLLQRWEQEMSRVQSFHAEMNRIVMDKTFGSTEEFVGVARYLKPSFASLEMHKKNKPEVYEKLLSSGNFVYQWVPASRVINVYELPPGQKADDNLLSFLFGMKAEEAKQRYDLKLVKEDQWYFYVEVTPKRLEDKVDFQRARLVFTASTFLPRQVWLEDPNGNEVTWDLTKVATNVRLDPTLFAPPTQPPAGWNMIKVPRAESRPRQDVQPPRVIRNQQ